MRGSERLSPPSRLRDALRGSVVCCLAASHQRCCCPGHRTVMLSTRSDGGWCLGGRWCSTCPSTLSRLSRPWVRPQALSSQPCTHQVPASQPASGNARTMRADPRPPRSAGLGRLRHVYANSNKISSIDDLPQLTCLRILSLSSNSIPSLLGLAPQPALEVPACAPSARPARVIYAGPGWSCVPAAHRFSTGRDTRPSGPCCSAAGLPRSAGATSLRACLLAARERAAATSHLKPQTCKLKGGRWSVVGGR